MGHSPDPLSLRQKWWPVRRWAAAGTTDADGEDSNGVPAARRHLCAKAWRRHTWLHGHSTVASGADNMARIGQRVLPDHAIIATWLPENDTAEEAGTPPPRRMTQHTCVPALTDQGAQAAQRLR